MNYQCISLQHVVAVAIVTLNKPDKLNCLNDPLVAELRHALADIATDTRVGAVVLTGAGRAFCAGGDIQEMLQTTHTQESAYRHMGKYHGLTRELSSLGKPVIAAVNGVAAGGGFSLALLCDLIVASEQARFKSAFRTIALVPDLAFIYNLTRMLGAQKVKEIVFLDTPIEAEEALRLGFVSRVVKAQVLLEEAVELAQSLVQGPRTMFRHCKQMIHLAAQEDFAAMLEWEANVQSMCLSTEEHKIARDAFINKTAPRYMNR